MNEIHSSPSPSPPAAAASITTTTTTGSKTNRKQEMSAMSRMKKDCLSFTVSLQESFRYIKAIFVGQVLDIPPFYITHGAFGIIIQ